MTTVKRELKDRFGIDSLGSNVGYAQWRDYVALTLMANRFDPHWSFHTPYLKALPKSLPHIPLFYDDKTRALLQGTSMEEVVQSKEKQYTDAWNRIRYQHESIDRLFTWEDYFWALAVVDSRSFSLTPPHDLEQQFDYESPLHLRYGNSLEAGDPTSPEAREMQTSSADGRTRQIVNQCQQHGSALVPLADMLNHADSPNVLWAFDPKSDAFILLAASELKAGTKAIDSYGRKGNKEFLGQYGFTLKEANVEIMISLDPAVATQLASDMGHWREKWCIDPGENDTEQNTAHPGNFDKICSSPNTQLEGNIIQTHEVYDHLQKVRSGRKTQWGMDEDLIFCQQNCLWDPLCGYWTIRRKKTAHVSYTRPQCVLYNTVSKSKRVVHIETTEKQPGDFLDYGYTSGTKHCLWFSQYCSFISSTNNTRRGSSYFNTGRKNDHYLAPIKIFVTQSTTGGTNVDSIGSPFIIESLNLFPHGLMPLLRSTAPPPMRCYSGDCTKTHRSHMVDEWALRLLYHLCKKRLIEFPSTIEEDKQLLFEKWKMEAHPDWPTVNAIKIRMW